MPFVSEPHGDAIVAKRPQLFDQAVIEFHNHRFARLGVTSAA
jgi:hypothetical protein